VEPIFPIDPTEPDAAGPRGLRQPPGLRPLGAVEHERLRESVYRRVFGAASPVELGRFTVLERIGSGGMGLVFKAYDMQLDRKVAVKVIRIDGASDSARRALVKEARALARLSHPNVVHVYEVGEGKGGELYLAMEFVEGVTLREWVARAKRGWREIVEVCLQAADGLAAAHAANLVHRDFKPDNVMVGDDARVRVLDFGLARTEIDDVRAGTVATRPELFAPLMTTVDRVQGVAGTPAYMAPEQITLGEIGTAADQFAFCASLWGAIVRAPAYPGQDAEALAAAKQLGPPA
jgi:serine/threonine protein kinase